MAALVLLAVTCAAANVAGQAVSLAMSPDGLHVRAPGHRFIDGPVLKRLRDGQSVPIEFALEVLAARAGRVLARADQRVNVSFDLWEQRFAVTRVGSPPRSVSQLSAIAAEAWCLENLVIPAQQLERVARDQPVWIRLVHRVPGDTPPPADEEGRLSLNRLIEVLSRRRASEASGRPLEAGPFRVPD